MIRKILSWSLFLCIGAQVQAQEQWNYSRIQHEVAKLPQQSTVLYIAAHPDDENTRLISWLANEKKFRTAYLSLTRGDGGQNLIGNELGVQLGIIRTHELAEARKIDGGEQYFTRAYDFGYSKTADETLTKWNRDSILSDMVFVIRKLQPDVIITRFATSGYPTHGHHTTSALLANEAFELAARADAFPEQFKYGVSPWKTQTLFYNASTWWNANLEQELGKMDSLFAVDVGTYNPLLGASYTEIAGRSRSMHKSQGFGSGEPVGKQLEFLVLVKGRMPRNRQNPFQEFEGSFSNKLIQNNLRLLSQNIDNKHFDNSLTELVNLHKSLEMEAKKSNRSLLLYKMKQVEEIILQLSGIVIRLEAEKSEIPEGSTLKSKFSILSRQNSSLKLIQVHGTEGIYLDSSYTFNTLLQEHSLIEKDLMVHLSPGKISDIPWMRFGKSESMFNSSWRNVACDAGVDAQFTVEVELEVYGLRFKRRIPLTYTSVDPVKGELRREVLVTPQYRISFNSNALLFANQSSSKTLNFTIEAASDYNGTLITGAGSGFGVKRKQLGREVMIKANTSFEGEVDINANNAKGSDLFSIRFEKPLFSTQLISYDHIGTYQYPQEATVPLYLLNIKPVNKKVAYVQGAGDEVDTYLRSAGLQVDNLELSQLKDARTTAKYPVLIFGIRAFNTLDFTTEYKNALLNYIKNGGHVIVQYNTSRRFDANVFSPYPLELGRNRITEEDATLEPILPKHPVFNQPHVLDSTSFTGWIQERGLYFAETADSAYIQLLQGHDSGEPMRQGILLNATYGKGGISYCGLSFFRELPAGVPSAYQLLLNLIALEQHGRF
ncbi:MAG: hypothetical protein EP332_11595 [Bacteroidetes bacterium]|nr:MAG: hypothetical protein EP332_11595 [Bacteroidota bacterium]